jgi:hypothetical protein
MSAVLISLLAGLASTLRTRTSLQVEILALRHHLAVLQRTKRRRVPLRAIDRLLWVALAHERRRVVHFNVTEHPTAEWTAAQLMQAFPWDTAPGTCCATVTESMVTLSGCRQ